MAERADHKTRFSPTNQPVKTGRSRESRDRLSQSFLKGLADDFEKHGVTAIEKVRKADPSTYLRVVASLQPKEFEVSDPLKNLSDEKLAEIVDKLSAELRDKTDKPKPEQRTVN